MAVLRHLALVLGLSAGAAPVVAQDLFSPVIVVNDQAVTGFELQQRALMLGFFNTSGDLDAVARQQLVEDRLKQQELDRVGFSISEGGLERALEEFASRASLDTAQFQAVLAENGVSPETLRDYVAINNTWREYVLTRFGERIAVTDADVDQRLAQESSAGQGIEVLLSEIIIPAPPPQAQAALARAQAISDAGGIEAFAQAAREVSAVPSRDNGGRLDWVPLANYPAALRDTILGLAPGEVTPPLELDGAVALLQLRDIREGAAQAAEPATIDYAVLRIPGGLSPAALSAAASLSTRIDACEDLYGEARGLPADRLTREAVAPGAIPPEIALQLAALDTDEATWGLTADGGATLLFTMLCSRDYALPDGVADRETVAGVIRNDRLASYSDAVVADLRAAATIVGE